MFKKIKRLSEAYRRHEKEMEQLKVEQIVQSGLNAMAQIQATFQGMIDTTVKTMELYKQQVADKKGLATGGIVTGLKPEICGEQRGHATVINKDVLDNIKSQIEASSNGKINVKIYPSNISKDKVN